MLRTVVGIVLIAHGIGHTMGLFPMLGSTKSAFWTGDSWLLTPALGDLARWISLPFWIVATIGFVIVGASALGLESPTASVRQIALASSIVSLVGLALFWNSFASVGSVVGAVAIDVLVIIGVLLEWPVAGSLGTN